MRSCGLVYGSAIVSLTCVAVGCGRIGFDVPTGDGATGIGSDGASGAMISGLVVPQPWGIVDLTAQGTRDWVHWGNGGTSATERKAAVPERIAGWARLGSADTHFVAAIPGNGFTWSDGAPTPSATAVESFVLLDTADTRGGFGLIVPADTTARRLIVYTGTFCARLMFDVRFDDFSSASFTDTSWDETVNKQKLGRVEVDYRAATAGVDLLFAVTIDENHCPTGDLGEVFIAAAALQ
jgi:hypothetical protein